MSAVCRSGLPCSTAPTAIGVALYFFPTPNARLNAAIRNAAGTPCGGFVTGGPKPPAPPPTLVGPPAILGPTGLAGNAAGGGTERPAELRSFDSIGFWATPSVLSRASSAGESGFCPRPRPRPLALPLAITHLPSGLAAH